MCRYTKESLRLLREEWEKMPKDHVRFESEESQEAAVTEEKEQE